jgi:hypothetical protein
MTFPRPSYPIAGDLFLGFFLIAWGLWLLVFPGTPQDTIKSLHWLWGKTEEYAVASGAILIGASKVVCICNRWQIMGKIAATLATGLWFQLGVKAFIADPNLHPPICAIYFCAAGCSVLTMLTEERE